MPTPGDPTAWVPQPGTQRRSVHGELPVQAADGAVTDVHVEAAGLDGELPVVVVEAEVRGPQRERHRPGLAVRERDPLEPVEPTDRLQDAGHLVVDVELDHVVTCRAAG